MTDRQDYTAIVSTEPWVLWLVCRSWSNTQQSHDTTDIPPAYPLQSYLQLLTLLVEYTWRVHCIREGIRRLYKQSSCPINLIIDAGSWHSQHNHRQEAIYRIYPAFQNIFLSTGINNLKTEISLNYA